MNSITTWNRLEPQTRNIDMEDSLRASIHDPLWLLGRQWQVGEFRGEDTGSPVEATISVTSDPVTQYRSGGPRPDAPAHPYPSLGPNGVPPPLEVLVERGSVRPSISGDSGTTADTTQRDLRLAVEAGHHFLRILAQKNLPSTVADYEEFLLSTTGEGEADDADESNDHDEAVARARTDEHVTQFEAVATNRALDGDALYSAIVSAGDTERDPITAFPLPATRDLTIDEIPEHREALTTYVQWYEDLYTQPTEGQDPNETGSAWNPDRLEYQFAIATGNPEEGTENVFAATEYHGDGLDWHAFSRSEESIGSPPEEATFATSETIEQRVVPTPVTFGGMPVSRWWEFEDHTVNFNQVETMPEDISRLLMFQFALIYNTDWYIVPWEVPISSLSRIDQFEVLDSFDQRWIIEPTTSMEDGLPQNGESSWAMFEFPTEQEDPQTGERGTTSGLLVPPTLVNTLTTEPVETVEFIRDEMANVAWAAEQTIEGRLGDPIRQRQAMRETTGADSMAENGDNQPPLPISDAAYRLATEVRPYWFPLLPEQIQLGVNHLVLGELLSRDGDASAVPRSRIMGHSTFDFSIPEEEIPKGGTTVERDYNLTRCTDGSCLLWAGQRKSRGSQENSSGLRFDVLEERIQ